MTDSLLHLIWIIPAAFLLILLAFVNIEKFLIVIAFLVPLSVQLRFLVPDTGFDLFLPTEPMLAVALVIMIFKLTAFREVDKNILRHPATIIVASGLLWSLIASLAGTMPLVSLKSLAARLWFVAGFYLLAAEVFKRKAGMMNYFKAFLAGMVPVVLYFLFRMKQAGFADQTASLLAVKPFFNDHTLFGATLAFCIPLILFLIFRKEASFLRRVFLAAMLIMFTAAFVLSYSRAAWLSIIVSFVLAAVLLLRISWKLIIPAIAVISIVVISSWSSLIIKIGDIRQESSGEIPEQIRSVANITTDVSNLERINRWKSAIRMSSEKPLLGWGPGTYQFLYAPFQVSTEKTEISTNWGERGNAHSEYLGALAESGWPGMLLYIALVLTVIARGIVLFRRTAERETRYFLLAVIAGLATYVVHGALNNFLDTDKVSALFWGMAAVVTAADIRSREKNAGDNS